MATLKKHTENQATVFSGDLGFNHVNMSNALVRAGHILTLAEKRIIAAAVSTLDSMRTPQPGECPVVKLSATDYAETFGLDTNTAYDQLQSAAKALYNRSIVFYEPAHKRNGKPIIKSQMRWVGKASYHKKEGWIELHFWHEVVPHLMGLRKQFTSYKLQQASSLRSIYSWKLLELLSRFQSTGWAEYTIEDFCTAMDATPKQQSDFGKIRTKIIEPAIKELNEKDNWVIEWQPIKAGRKVKAVHFDFKRDTQGRLF